MTRFMGLVAVIIGTIGMQLGYPAELNYAWMAGGAVIMVVTPRRWDWVGRLLYLALGALEAWIVLAFIAGVR